MTKEQNPNSGRKKRRRLLWLGGISLTALGASLGYGWFFLNKQLTPLIEIELSNYLNRPVKVGAFQGISFDGVNFGPTEIPTTSNDPDRASANGVKVSFDPLLFLTQQRLDLNVTLINPDVYVEQDERRNWLSIKLKSRASSKEQGIKVDLKTLYLQNGSVTLVARDKENQLNPPLKTILNSGVGYFLPDNFLDFNLTGNLANGGSLKLQGKFNTKTSGANLNLVAQQIEARDVTNLVSLPLSLEAGKTDAQLNIQLRKNQTPRLNGTATAAEITAIIPALTQPLTKTKGVITFDGYKINFEDVSSFYGAIAARVNGVLDTKGDFNLKVQSSPADISQIIAALKLPPPALSLKGLLQADIFITGAISKPVATFQVVNTGTTSIDKINFQSLRANIQLVGKTLFVKQLLGLPQLGGRTWGNGVINLPAGDDSGNLAFSVWGDRLPSLAFLSLYNPKFPVSLGLGTAKVELQAPLDNLAQVRGTGVASFPVGEGSVKLNQIKYANNTWQTQLEAFEVDLKNLGIKSTLPTLDPIILNSQLQVSGKNFELTEINAIGKGKLKIAKGWVIIDNFTLNKGEITTKAQLNNLASAELLPQLRGNLTGDVNLAANVNQLSLETIKAQGNITLSEGVSVITNPISAQVKWDGKRLNIIKANSPGIIAAGFVDSAKISLAVETNSLPLQSLALPKVTKPLSALVNFKGEINGDLKMPTIKGAIKLNNLSYCLSQPCNQEDKINFETVMDGNIKITPTQPLNLAVAGVNDKIEVLLNKKFQPDRFLVKLDQATIIGNREAEMIRLRANEFPLKIFKQVKNLNVKVPLGGNISGNIDVNLTTLAAQGKVAIASPLIGRFRGESLKADLEYSNNQIFFSNGELAQGKSKYLFEANLIITEKQPEFEAHLKIVNGNIQDVFKSLQYFKFADFAQGLNSVEYATSEELYLGTNKTIGEPLFSVGVTEPNLEKQKQIIEQILPTLSTNRNLRIADKITELPELASLEGVINGEMSLSNTENNGLGVSFNLQGQQWRWGKFGLDQLIAKGTYQKGVLKLIPLRLKDGDKSLTISGSYGLPNQAIKIELVNFPLDLVKNFVNLPKGINFTSKVNAYLGITGKSDNPKAFGKLALIDTKINNVPISATQGEFQYKNARLDFKLNTPINNKIITPLRIKGTIPYKLPFASVKPNNDNFEIDVSLENEGFILLNLLTEDKIKWVGGEGNFKGKITGLFNPIQGGIQQPKVQATGVFKQGIITSKIFPDTTFSDIKGEIFLKDQRLTVNNFSSNFSQGTVNITGNINLFDANNQDLGLKVSLNNIKLNLPSQYVGMVEGTFLISNTLLAPSLGGNLNLSNGQFFLSDRFNNEQNLDNTFSLNINNFTVNLLDNIQIIKNPLLNFTARGSLTLKGDFNNLNPEGTIKLERGVVNLFTSRLRLDNNYNNTARFNVNSQFDPFLDLRLIGSVNETYPRGLLRIPNSSEINDINPALIGTLQTIRIQALINGYASQIDRNLKLTSSPPRSQNQILALLGGGLVDTIQQDQTVITLANIAGAAFFGTFQGTVADALGLSELQIFPTPILQDRQRTTVLGLAIEIGVDLTNRLTFSVLKILTTEQLPQIGVRYRLNDQTVIRGSTNFSSDSRAIIEYEQRF